MQPTQENNIEEKKEVIQEQINTQNKEIVQSETIEQINWKKFREQREIERKQKEAAEKRAIEKSAEAEALKAAMESLLNKQPNNQVNNQFDEESDEQKLKKLVSIALEEKEKQYEEQRRQREQQEFPQKLATAYKDFNQVCTTDNLDYLEYHYPEVAAGFKYMPDGFDKWSAVYQAVKRFVTNTDNKKDQKKAEQNFNKPQSMAVSGVTQTGDSAPIMLDDKRKADNYARMQRVMKGGK